MESTGNPPQPKPRPAQGGDLTPKVLQVIQTQTQELGDSSDEGRNDITVLPPYQLPEQVGSGYEHRMQSGAMLVLFKMFSLWFTPPPLLWNLQVG